MLSPYWPGSSREAGKLKRPLSSVGTLTVTVEPTFLALTTTPSMAPSLSDVTRPARAAFCAKAGADNNKKDATKPKAATIALRRMTISLDYVSLLLVEHKHRPCRAPPQSGGAGSVGQDLCAGSLGVAGATRCGGETYALTARSSRRRKPAGSTLDGSEPSWSAWVDRAAGANNRTAICRSYR